jgi:mRNA-degrading endonuclease toxin of MazEF toxin-antitoxin module
MGIQRGEVYKACLDPVFGHEMGGFKERPVLVVSINDINEKTRMITIVPGSSTKKSSSYRNVVMVQRTEDNGLASETFFHCHQVRAIERGRLMTRRPLGHLSRDDLGRVEKSLAYCMGLVPTE